jgi:hypothetical protein
MIPVSRCYGTETTGMSVVKLSSHLFDGSNRAMQIKNEGQFISLATLQEPHIWQRSQVNGLPMSV